MGLSAAVHEGPSIGTPVNIGTAASSPTAETITITVGASGVPAGQTIFVAVSTRGGNTTTGLPSVEDSVNGAYQQDLLGMNASGGTKGGLFRFTDNAALVEDDTITVTLLDGITNVQAATAFYVSGLDLDDPLDQSAVTSDGGTATSSGSITTTSADQFILGFLASQTDPNDDGPVTQDADFTSGIAPSFADAGMAGNDRYAFAGYRIVSATETQNYAPTLSTSRVWVAGIASYKAASGGGLVNADLSLAVVAGLLPSRHASVGASVGLSVHASIARAAVATIVEALELSASSDLTPGATASAVAQVALAIEADVANAARQIVLGQVGMEMTASQEAAFTAQVNAGLLLATASVLEAATLAGPSYDKIRLVAQALRTSAMSGSLGQAGLTGETMRKSTLGGDSLKQAELSSPRLRPSADVSSSLE